jgi:sec-independent protein translocase protein TatB
MFDIGFSEIVVIAVVALIVIGPEKLPKTARTLGHLFGRLQRYVSDVKADINREMELDELRKLQTQVQSAAREVETSFDAAKRDLDTGVRNVEQQLSDAPGGAAGAAAPAAAGAPVTASSLPELTTPPGTVAPSTTVPAAPAEPARQASLPGFDRG